VKGAHGLLGAVYPPSGVNPRHPGQQEGDTPSFLHLVSAVRGLNDPEKPDQGGWGGLFAWAMSPDKQTHASTNHPGTQAHTFSRKYLARFYPATFSSFAARMDWAKAGAGNRDPVVAINGDRSLDMIKVAPAEGTSVTLDAGASSDPDGDKLTFSWWVLSEAGTYAEEITLSGPESNRVTVKVPSNAAGKSFHIICEVTDNGAHPLTSYRRIIFEPTDRAPEG
jgi:hypothetical protein